MASYNGYGQQMGPTNDELARKQAMLATMNASAPPPAPPPAAVAPPPVASGGSSNGGMYNPTTNPGGTELPDANVVLQGPNGQTRTMPNPRYQPDVITPDMLPKMPAPYDPGGYKGPDVPRATGGPVLAPQASSSPPPPPNANPGFVPGGWDATKWNDPGKHDLKYDLGHLLAGVSNNGQISAADVQKVAPQLEQMGIKWDGGDGLTMPDGNRVDFIKGMKAGGGTGTLNWLDSTMQGGPGHVAPTSPTITPSLLPGGSFNDPTINDPSFMQNIQKQIAALSDSDPQKQAMLKLMSNPSMQENPNPPGSDAYYEWMNQHRAPMSLATWSKNPATGQWSEAV